MKEKITDQKESIKQKSYSESEPDECLLDRRHKINVRFLNVLLVFDQLPMPMLSFAWHCTMNIKHTQICKKATSLYWACKTSV